MLSVDAKEILDHAVKNSLPYESTVKILREPVFSGDALTVFCIGKAAIPMARAAADVLGARIKIGLAVTKYGHTGDFSSPYFEVMEAAHPISDENSVKAAQKALKIADGLTANDTVLVLLSGGGSALFEESLVSLEDWQTINRKLLSRSAPIEEMNTLRRRFSLVKGGKFAARCYPAKVITVALSDVLSNDKSVIAGGITVKDGTSDDDVRALAQKYLYDVPESLLSHLYTRQELPIHDGGYYFAGDIHTLVDGACEKAAQLGYTPHLMTSGLRGEARSAAVDILDGLDFCPGKHAYIYGGETTVTVTGSGLGGRNQELALSAAIVLRSSHGILFASLGSDGTDGPTDAAGGMVDGETYEKIRAEGLSPEDELENNNAYFALKAADALLMTGATGTNVNDITLILIE